MRCTPKKSAISEVSCNVSNLSVREVCNFIVFNNLNSLLILINLIINLYPIFFITFLQEFGALLMATVN